MRLTDKQTADIKLALGSNGFTITEIEEIQGDKVLSLSHYEKTGCVALRPDGSVEVIRPLEEYMGPYSRQRELEGL